MSLLENLNEAEKLRPAPKVCIVARQIRDAKLSDKETKKLVELMVLPASYEETQPVPTVHLARALRKSGIPVSDKSLERHRKGDCSCYR